MTVIKENQIEFIVLLLSNKQQQHLKESQFETFYYFNSDLHPRNNTEINPFILDYQIAERLSSLHEIANDLLKLSINQPSINNNTNNFNRDFKSSRKFCLEYSDNGQGRLQALLITLKQPKQPEPLTPNHNPRNNIQVANSRTFLLLLREENQKQSGAPSWTLVEHLVDLMQMLGLFKTQLPVDSSSGRLLQQVPPFKHSLDQCIFTLLDLYNQRPNKKKLSKGNAVESGCFKVKIGFESVAQFNGVCRMLGYHQHNNTHNNTLCQGGYYPIWWIIGKPATNQQDFYLMAASPAYLQTPSPSSSKNETGLLTAYEKFGLYLISISALTHEIPLAGGDGDKLENAYFEGSIFLSQSLPATSSYKLVSRKLLTDERALLTTARSKESNTASLSVKVDPCWIFGLVPLQLSDSSCGLSTVKKGCQMDPFLPANLFTLLYNSKKGAMSKDVVMGLEADDDKMDSIFVPLHPQ